MSDVTRDETNDAPYDVLVIGGGAAGLSGALALARARRRVLVVDAGEPRNAPAGHVHNYLGHEGTPPGELLAAGRTEVASYGGEVTAGEVVAARPWDADGTGFVVTLADGRELAARRLLVTTGLVDELPGTPGLRERWGRDVLHCPYCHGWEVRDQALGVLWSGPLSLHQAHLFRQWSADVMLFLDGHPAPEGEEAERLAARGIRVVPDAVEGVVVEDDHVAGLRLAGGELVARDAVVVAPRFVARSPVLASLGIAAEEQRMGEAVMGDRVPADPTGMTALDGVWVAGNVTDLGAQVIGAAAAGLKAGAVINLHLVEEETAAAVEHRRAVVAMFEPPAWEERYAGSSAVWSGRPNPQLVAEATGLAPGRALDVGSGEGADAIWLAARGWRVTGLDFSTVALEKAAGHAAAAGVGDRVEWCHADLRTWRPDGPAYDLVTSQFMHQPDGAMTALVGRLAEAVAPGGTLLVVGHHPRDHATGLGHGVPDMLFTAEDLLPALDPGAWEVEAVEARPRQAPGPDGGTVAVHDAVLRARRR